MMTTSDLASKMAFSLPKSIDGGGWLTSGASVPLGGSSTGCRSRSLASSGWTTS